MPFARPALTPIRAFAAFASMTSIALIRAHAAGTNEPLWAYGYTTPAAPGERAEVPKKIVPARTVRLGEDLAGQTRLRHIDGSTRAFSLLEIRNGNDVVDWFPDEHPPLSALMRRGPASLGENAFGCAFCHMPNGKGRSENAPVSGLPVPYFIRQMQDMRNGLRRSADPRKANTLSMILLAKAMTDAEIKEAAQYFASLPATPWIRVVETDRVPRTRSVSGMFLPVEREHSELLAGRIIEVPENPDETELLRNPHSGFVAYAPIGSVRKGELLVTTGGATLVAGRPVPGKTVACSTCHGPDLKGVAEVPGIAGRSPSYLARQIYDIQQGTRQTPLSRLMQPVVANFTADDIVAVVAYVASLGQPAPLAPR